MGHVVNPTGFRLGIVHSFFFVWHVQTLCLYSYVSHKLRFAANYVQRVLAHRRFRSLFLFNNFRVLFIAKTIHVMLSIYPGDFAEWFGLFDIKYSMWWLWRWRPFARWFRLIWLRFLALLSIRLWVFETLKYIILKDLLISVGLPIYCSFLILSAKDVSASGITSLITWKMKRKVVYGKIMSEILGTLKQLIRRNWLSGYRIKCSGRTSRRGRSNTTIRSFGPMPLSSATAFISYHCRSVILKNSICGLKIWLFYGDYPDKSGMLL